MDVFTHFIIGASIGEIAPKDIKNRHAIGAGFAILPDITNVIFVHPYLGWLAGHTIPFAVLGFWRTKTKPATEITIPFGGSVSRIFVRHAGGFGQLLLFFFTLIMRTKIEQNISFTIAKTWSRKT